ncbi:TonB-dependent receptor [Parafilimonas sp.]|uniref:TonB-dependent receptor n=1 Tax=Parafilimonas sp. TaxID=1969739 RepID=UPI0039E4AD9A
MQTSLLTAVFLAIALYGFCQQNTIENNITNPNTETDSSFIGEWKDNAADNIPIITLDDNDLGEASAQNISSLLTAGHDPFYNAATFNFSVARFRIRGYNADNSATYINGVPMDNLDNGYTPYGLWGGLNDVFRNRDINFGIRYNTFAFGDIGNSTHIDVRASKQRTQTGIGYALSNRSYDHRIIFTHSTGLNKQGWAFTVSGSWRYADEGYAPGTYFNGYSWFAAVDKKLGQKQILSFVAFAAPTESGRQSASTQEMTGIAGTHYYNPLWGYQNGRKRNAGISQSNQPVILLTHDFRITNKTNITTSLGYISGKRLYSALDWYNAPDPRPDYYRYLPSYYKDDAYQQQQVYDNLKNNEAARQINWDNLYNINRYNTAAINNANGVEGNTVTGNRSYYILGERVTNSRRIIFNSVLNAHISDHIDFTAGESYQSTNNNYFQRIKDLLGGSFWVDVNQFAQREFPTDNTAYQNDLNHPSRIVKTGGKYGYDYNIKTDKIAAWSQFVFRFPHIDFFIAGEGSQTIFRRIGNVRNGLFPNNSYGKSAPNLFYNYAVKGGITYKINGRNYLSISSALLTRAPYFEDAYVSPRTRDFVQDSLRSENIQTLEGGYILNAPKLKIHLIGYYTQMKHAFNVLTFYHDEYRDFVNYALSHIDKLYFGGEFGFEANIARNITISGAAAVGRYYYNSRQQAITTVDNTATILNKETVYSNNYRIPSTPQNAYSFTVTYRSPKFWIISLTGNYFDYMWLDFNPVRRTALATENLDPKSDLFHAVIDQQRLDAQYTIDVFAGYSWKIPHTYIGSGFHKKPLYLAMYAGISNMLNNRDIISGGYEQLRYDYTTSDINKFPPKYYYAYGLNYFASIALRF